ncbi:hypothetical protein CC77DRAFT_231703 [Alternaria alternata]|jgi:hypothetical protein|uniref:Uncharacterized protein n=1 Tax=Alternaria alternata TaxID=5599 RepID=A0A177DGL0_ALTAL|nr:hypothetical protein CC77DRAFT_231703 [Alternaria alternata]KAH8625307.1 hypothetical protein IG631_19186 [Alternaria alternata]OAG18391.1 hypothetical protein CC77DRAFT_231703 [Alternaria alternata]
MQPYPFLSPAYLSRLPSRGSCPKTKRWPYRSWPAQQEIGPPGALWPLVAVAISSVSAPWVRLTASTCVFAYALRDRIASPPFAASPGVSLPLQSVI